MEPKELGEGIKEDLRVAVLVLHTLAIASFWMKIHSVPPLPLYNNMLLQSTSLEAHLPLQNQNIFRTR